MQSSNIVINKHNISRLRYKAKIYMVIKLKNTLYISSITRANKLNLNQLKPMFSSCNRQDINSKHVNKIWLLH